MMKDRVFIIAEAGVNHNGSVDRALQMVKVAAEAGADAIKFQTFQTNLLVTRAAPKAAYQHENTGESGPQYEMLEKLELDSDAHHALAACARQSGIMFLSTPFDVTSLQFLVREMRVPMLKISSGDLTNAQLLLAAARTDCRIILSTGMATMDEVESALAVLAFGFTGGDEPSQESFRLAYNSERGRQMLRARTVLLHCVTEYPAPVDSLNLRAVNTMQQVLGLPVGYSDHSEGILMPAAAVALGAVVIEKHFTLDKGLPGPDHLASLLPGELAEMVQAIRKVELALGNGTKAPAQCELHNVQAARKRLVAARPIGAGERFSQENIVPKRATTGISASLYWDVLGQQAARDYLEDEGIE
jgi:N-acetylneuraminate synthase